MFGNRLTWQIAIISILVLSLAYIFSTVMAYVIVSLIISTVLSPLSNYLSHIRIFSLRIPRAIAVMISMTILIGVIVLLAVTFSPLLIDQLTLLSTLDLESLLFKLEEPITLVERFLKKNRLASGEPGFLMDLLERSIIGNVLSFDLTNLISEITRFTFGIVISVLAVLFISFFFLMEKGIVKKAIIRLIPNAYFELSITALYQIEHLLSNYLIGLLVEILAIFALVALGLSYLGVPYALTIGLFAAIAHIIPYVGAFLGILFGIVIGLSTAPSGLESNFYLIFAVKIFLVHWLTLMVDNFVIQPIIFSRSVHAHPLEIFIVIFIGAALADALGMILAIPAYTIIRVTLTQLALGYGQYTIFRPKQHNPILSIKQGNIVKRN